MPRHLDELTVHRFRGLREVSLTDLRGVNLFVGANDSGKTSILEAIAIFAQPLLITPWLEAARRREIVADSTPSPVLLKWLFPHVSHSPATAAVSSVSISGRGPSVRFQSSEATFLVPWRLTMADSPGEIEREETGLIIQLFVAPDDGPKLDARFEIWNKSPIILDEPPQGAIKVKTITPVSHRVEQLQLWNLSEVTIEGFKPRIVDLLRKVDPQIQDIEILWPKGERPSIYINHAFVGSAPLAIFGDGIRRALSIGLTLASVENGFLLIDEIEASIHVSALGPLFKWLVEGCAEFNVQLFATTHSLEAVDAILESNGDESDLAAFRLRQESSGIVCQRLSGDLLHRLRYERGLDVRV